MADTQINTGLAGDKATMTDTLALHELVVIGVMDAHDGAAALLRSSRGQVARVQVGDSVFGVQITAIDDAQVVLTDRWGRTQSLALPQS